MQLYITPIVGLAARKPVRKHIDVFLSAKNDFKLLNFLGLFSFLSLPPFLLSFFYCTAARLSTVTCHTCL